MPAGRVATGAGAQRAQQVHFGEELQVVARTHRARFHEVLMCVLGEACTHEDIQHIVDVFLRFRDTMLCQRANQVGMAAMVVILTFQQVVGIGVTAGADDIVDAGTVLIKAIPCQGVVSDGGHRSQKWEAAPEAIPFCQMCRMQLSRLAAVESLLKIAGAPQVEIPHLRPFHAANAKEVALGHVEASSLAWRHHHLPGFPPILPGALVETNVHLGQ
mmetsp:Transcript_64400/g.141204  ORF Transcript_64400/g.141204 Transcript_64400/m.141204 type:complete len:216 (-) Transcript_64400:46-693(-)